MKLKNSLLSKYLLIILIATMIMPMSFPIISILFYMPLGGLDNDTPDIYQNGTHLEKRWHEEAAKLGKASDEEINQKLNELKKEYSKASMFWVDETGKTQKKLPEDLTIPQNWTVSYSIDFIKKNRGYDADPFTVVAFIGEQKNEGFMVIQVPRSLMASKTEMIREQYDYVMALAVLFILVLFVFVSWVFFYKVRKRLLRLQEAMSKPGANGIPIPLEVEKEDEIGQLVKSFNQMVHQLEMSRKREKEEEDLRRHLIANLSHDLRTPLTTIRGHAYLLNKEPLSEKGKQSLELIDQKINYLGQLIENLLSYTLLSAGKYPFHPKKADIVQLVKKSFAAWYPVFENEGFDIVLGIPDKGMYWQVDTEWFDRILDNFFQNILRHAKSGKYVSIRMEQSDGQSTIVIEDRGPGMGGKSNEKGAGIGLSIVSLMLKEMKIKWEINSMNDGTRISLFFMNS
ncbi:histidine kinase dimerization/phospho-acceptor domain-containing protein [Bacillus songklensis]|uniref:histidine kinase n=1 Tax=Bacillus songklensis TaxID=1069116 RepID=A0ABV8B6N1_9BACI